MAMLGKSWVFWLGLLIFAAGGFLFFVFVEYLSSPFYRYMVPGVEAEIVTGIAFVIAGLYMMYPGRNKPGSPAETILL
jgi:hypothetical protein